MKPFALCIPGALFFCLLLSGRSDAQSQDSARWVKDNLNSLLELYVHFHSNPELSYEEKETAARLADELKKIGCEVTTDVGGHGVVALLNNGDGPTVMLRTDLDALPVTEKTGLAFASKKTVTDASGKKVGVMHACGHDVHMTNLIGTARYLASHKDRWQGTVMFIGQPAEERGAGAKAMLEDGLFERFTKPDFALAIHVNAQNRSGTVLIREGFVMANVNSVDIKITGRGGHGAYPHTTIDPIVIAAKLVVDLQTIVSREVEPIEPAVITVGSIHGGSKHNIIPDDCHLQLTVRSYSDEVRDLLLKAIERKAKAACESAGAEPPEVEVSEGTPSLSNDPKLTARIRKVIEQTIGEENVIEADKVMGGEDFSRYGRAGVPILMYKVGVVEPRKLEFYESQQLSPPSLHSAEFAPDIEPVLTTALQSMIESVISLMPVDK